MSTDVKRLVERIAAEADQTSDKPMPPGVRPTKPNKSTPVAVRLSSDEVDVITEMASRLGVPVSSLLRSWIVAALRAHSEESLTTAIDRLAADVQRLRELAA